MTWPPLEMVGVEVPPNKPGLAVIKRVGAGEAEPGDTLTFTIQYRNMGNTPIRAVSIVDSLLPRLDTSPAAPGARGAVFTADENRVGSSELRWDLPGAVAPGRRGLGDLPGGRPLRLTRPRGAVPATHPATLTRREVSRDENAGHPDPIRGADDGGWPFGVGCGKRTDPPAGPPARGHPEGSVRSRSRHTRSDGPSRNF